MKMQISSRNKNIHGNDSYLNSKLYSNLWDNAGEGITYHFIYEWWGKNDGLWTIHKFVDGRLDEDGLDYYKLKKGVSIYKNKPNCKGVFIYRYSRKSGIFELKRKVK